MNNHEKTTKPPTTPTKTKPDTLKILVGLLSLTLIMTWVYLVYHNHDSNQIQQSQQQTIAKVSTEKSELQANFDGALTRLDSLTGVNSNLNLNVSNLKSQIRSILKKERLTEEEKNKAQHLIQELNNRISNIEQENVSLKKDNQQLNLDKVALTSDKDNLIADKDKLTKDLEFTTTSNTELEKKVDIASTLNADNIIIVPVHEKKNGKVKETTSVKKVDKLLISFDVSNRISLPGEADVYVCVYEPNGTPINSGTFTTREEGDKIFTTKQSVNIEADKKTQVSFSWKGSDFKAGVYKIEIYHNGFKIGDSAKEIKKSGLF